MTQPINNGGSAYPCAQPQCSDGSWNQTYDPGMSLRDWFAGQFIAGLYGTEPGSHLNPVTAAREAYHVADAMIAAREAAQ